MKPKVFYCTERCKPSVVCVIISQHPVKLQLEHDRNTCNVCNIAAPLVSNAEVCRKTRFFSGNPQLRTQRQASHAQQSRLSLPARAGLPRATPRAQPNLEGGGSGGQEA